LSGDSFVSDLALNAGAAGLGFVETVLGLNLVDTDLRGLIDNQAAPVVYAEVGNSVVHNINSWIAFGGCVGLNTFDAVTARPGAERLAEFSDPNRNLGAYPYSALTRNTFNVTNDIISQTYDFSSVCGDQANNSGGIYYGGIQLLSDIFDAFGIYRTALPADVADLPAKFQASAYPNPFNPVTKIAYTIKAAGHLSLKVYNVRGQLVKTLIDGHVDADSFVMWDGTNNQGANVSSGVYFYEARMGNDVKVNKLALVK